jgi:hypothetical protein
LANFTGKVQPKSFPTHICSTGPFHGNPLPQGCVLPNMTLTWTIIISWLAMQLPLAIFVGKFISAAWRNQRGEYAPRGGLQSRGVDGSAF